MKTTERGISFTLLGDPVPYLRMTQGQVKLMRIPDHKVSANGLKLKKRIKRYFDWKNFVSVHVPPSVDRKPKEKVFLNVKIWFRNKKHADPENVRKGIQDAIFEQDKYVAGNVDFSYDADNPRCEVDVIQ